MSENTARPCKIRFPHFVGGQLPPSKQALTPDEAEFHATWRGRVVTVYSPEDALRKVLG
jgi:hypothetical protein